MVIEAAAELSPVAADPHDATVEALIRYYEGVSGAHPDWDEYRVAMINGQAARGDPASRTCLRAPRRLRPGREKPRVAIRLPFGPLVPGRVSPAGVGAAGGGRPSVE